MPAPFYTVGLATNFVLLKLAFCVNKNTQNLALISLYQQQQHDISRHMRQYNID